MTDTYRQGHAFRVCANCDKNRDQHDFENGGACPVLHNYLLVGLYEDGQRWADYIADCSDPDAAEDRARDAYPGVTIAAVIELKDGVMGVVA